MAHGPWSRIKYKHAHRAYASLQMKINEILYGIDERLTRIDNIAQLLQEHEEMHLHPFLSISTIQSQNNINNNNHSQ